MRQTLYLVICLFSLIAFSRNTEAADCGDFDSSGRVDITDVVYFINYVFASGPAPSDDANGDIDCNDRSDITDAVFMINFIFASGPAPCDGPGCAIGLLLPGEPNSPATAAVIKYGPVAAKASDVDSTGLLRSRLTAALNPEATVGEVNSALAGIGATISWMTPGELPVTIAIPAVASKAQADSIGGLLVASGAFLFADAAYGIDFNRETSRHELPPTGTNEIFHLRRMRMPAAWNAKKLVEDVNTPVTVLIPDGYYNAVQHPEIPSQSFISGNGDRALISTVDGNHGFRCAGIVGARHDNKNTTGLHPGPEDLLHIRSLMIGGLSHPEISSEITEHMPTGRFVLNTSFGFSEDLSGFSKAKRAIQALTWRNLVRNRQNDFIHITTAGNEGANTDASRYAAFSSPFNVSAAFASPFDLFEPGEIGPLDYAMLMAFWEYYLLQSPFNALATSNVIAVGSSDANGSESSFSSPGSVVRVLGEEVAAPCVRSDPPDIEGGCFQSDGGLYISYYDGTSFAAPQVAGLAAYLLSLNPTLSNGELKDIIYNAYINSPNSGFVDGYLATLMVDEDLGHAPVRETILDVANSSGAESPDDEFNEHDLLLFLAKFNEYEQLRAGVPNAPEDYSRYDLNGDGFTGGDNLITRFDLDINSPPQFTTVAIDFDTTQRTYDENILADLDILCYYANTQLYTGDTAIRDSLMVNCPNCDANSRNAGQCEPPFALIVRLMQMTGKSCYRYKDQPIICPVDSLFMDRDSTDIMPLTYTMPVRYNYGNPEGNPDSTVLRLGIDTRAEYDSVLQRATFDLTTGAQYYANGFVDTAGFCNPLYYANGTSFVYYTFDVGAGYEGLLALHSQTEMSLTGHLTFTGAYCLNRVLQITPGGNIIRYIDSLRVNSTNPSRQADIDTTITLQPGRYVIIRNIQPVGSTVGSCSAVTADVSGFLHGVLQISAGTAKSGYATRRLPATLSPELLQPEFDISSTDVIPRK